MIVGAVVTGILFTIGKSLIGWYIGSSAVASSFGAAGALIVLLLWIYYSALIFLLGAEFTKIYANWHGGKQDNPVPEAGDDAPNQSAARLATAQARPPSRPGDWKAWLLIVWLIAAFRLVRELSRKRQSRAPRRS